MNYIYDVQEFTVTVAAAATSGTQAEPCNPIRGKLISVMAKVNADTTVTGFKVELTRVDNVGSTVQVYQSEDTAIPDDGDWHDADSGPPDVVLNYPKDGDYTWKVTTDGAATAAMSVKIRRIVEA